MSPSMSRFPILVRVLAAISALLVAGAALAQPSIDTYPAQPVPASDYEVAARVFQAGDRLVGTCLFYRAQYRARVHLAAKPGLDPSGEPALYASLNEVIGRPINEWAGADVEDWTDAMQCALDWASTHDDPFLPRARYRKAHDEVARGLAAFIADTRGSADEIRRQRAANGLKNR